jgi:hypothetical protein
MFKSWFGRLVAATSLVYLAIAPIRAAEEPPGLLWETTSQMVMDGMPMKMPAQKLKICAAREWTRPPDGGDPSCVTSNFKKDGAKATWTVQCTGEMKMTGVGEMTFEGTDSYNGSVKFTAEGGMNMTVNLSGQKIGTCDKPLN